MYPNILNLHGDRGNLMALKHFADILGLKLEIIRHEGRGKPVDLSSQLLFFTPGELCSMPSLIAALLPQKDALAEYLTKGGQIVAIGSSGAIFAQEIEFLEQGREPGLGFFDMVCKERSQVYGDDISFEIDGEIQVLGNQIQVMDSFLSETQPAFGRLVYGHGNNGQGRDEGAQRGNLIFTNTLGPLLVKNPRLVLILLQKMANALELGLRLEFSPEDIELEDNSARLINKFIAKKMP